MRRETKWHSLVDDGPAKKTNSAAYALASTSCYFCAAALAYHSLDIIGQEFTTRVMACSPFNRRRLRTWILRRRDRVVRVGSVLVESAR
jgi:hypothetical protein